MVKRTRVWSNTPEETAKKKAEAWAANKAFRELNKLKILAAKYGFLKDDVITCDPAWLEGIESPKIRRYKVIREHELLDFDNSDRKDLLDLRQVQAEKTSS
jgi:hypothetical protein